MDRITRSFIQELLTQQELESEGEAKDFEKLVNYTVVSNSYNGSFNIDYVTVGEGNDTGIDGIAIIVNGQMVESTDEIDDLIERNGTLEVTFIFSQAKTSSSFNSGEINTFVFGIKDFFSESPQLVRNEDIQKFAEISDYLYENAAAFKSNPDIKLYFVTTGNWTGDQNLSAVIEAAKTELEQKNLFNKITFEPYGARELAAAYRKTKEAIILASNNVVPLMNSERLMNRYCEPIIEILNDENQYLPLYQQATATIDNADFDLDDKQHVKQASKTQILIDALN